MEGQLPILDATVLAKLKADVGDDAAVFLIDSLIKEIRSAQTTLTEYVRTNDMHLLENQAHALKSATRSFGALRLGAICAALEEGAKTGAAETLIKGLLADFVSVSEDSVAAFD